jgi:hypothetical protein
METKQILEVYQGSILKVLGKTWAQAVDALPDGVRTVAASEKPFWGVLWYEQGENGALSCYKENADSSD